MKRIRYSRMNKRNVHVHDAPETWERREKELASESLSRAIQHEEKTVETQNRNVQREC